MGNRAVIHFKNDSEKHGIYLHWNGGPESILAFLHTMQARGWLSRLDYASARFCAVVGEFFDAQGDDNSGLSLGCIDDPAAWAGGCDNGLYEVSLDAQGALVVLQRGRKCSVELLETRDRAQYERILEHLAQLRTDRKLMAQKRAVRS